MAIYFHGIFFRFLPYGIYLDALKLGVEGLAKEMNDIINSPRRYYDFFKWHDYYSFHDAGADDYRESVCAFCAFLNTDAYTQRYKKSVYNNILGWWNVKKPEEFPNSPYPISTTILTTEKLEKDSENSPSLELEQVTTSSLLSNIIDLLFGID